MSPKKLINVHTHIHAEQDLDARVALWRECGLVKVCVHVTRIGSGPPDEMNTNAGVLEFVKKHPDIVLGFALPDLGWRVGGSHQVDMFKDQGFKGLKFIAPSYAYDDDRYFPLYERAEALDMPILFHTGFLAVHEGQGAMGVSTDKMRPVRLDTIARAFPNLRMVMAHLGNPEYHVGLDVIKSFPNIWADFSGSSGSKARESVLRKVFEPMPGADMADPQENLALQHFEKICFATDNPPPPRWIALSERVMDELELPDDLQERFWWKNAAAWLGIEKELS